MFLSADDIKQKFRQPLPGLSSHVKMAPATRSLELAAWKDKIQLAKKSAVLILLFPDNGQIKTVLIKRSEYEGVHSGQMAFPGGKREKTDRDFEATALRETAEEIGVQPHEIEIIAQLSDLFVPPSNFLIKVFVGLCDQKPDYVLDKKEVQAVVEVALSDLFDEQNRLEKEFFAGALNLKITAPYYKVNNVEIWGATAMIISELLDVLRN